MRQDRNKFGRRLPAALLAGCLAVLLAVAPMASVGARDAAPASLEEAMTQVERQHPGRILSARSERRDGRVVYLIRVLTHDQQVRNVELPGAEGARP